jgi:hypothetical protein
MTSLITDLPTDIMKVIIDKTNLSSVPYLLSTCKEINHKINPLYIESVKKKVYDIILHILQTIKYQDILSNDDLIMEFVSEFLHSQTYIDNRDNREVTTNELYNILSKKIFNKFDCTSADVQTFVSKLLILKYMKSPKVETSDKENNIWKIMKDLILSSSPTFNIVIKLGDADNNIISSIDMKIRFYNEKTTLSIDIQKEDDKKHYRKDTFIVNKTSMKELTDDICDTIGYGLFIKNNYLIQFNIVISNDESCFGSFIPTCQDILNNCLLNVGIMDIIKTILD